MRTVEHTNDEMRSGCVEKMIEDWRHTKTNIYEKTKKPVNVFADGWRSNLSTLT